MNRRAQRGAIRVGWLVAVILGIGVVLAIARDILSPSVTPTVARPAAPVAAPPAASSRASLGPPAGKPKAGSEDGALQKVLNTYSGRGLDNSWPQLGDGQAPAGVAADLTAANYYVIFDGSGSMEKTGCSGGSPKIDVAKSAVSAFFGRIPATSNVGLFVFDRAGASERVPLGKGNRDKILQAINQVQADGGTPLWGAVDAGLRALTVQARSQLGYGEYNLVVITDGFASKGHSPRPAVSKLLSTSPVVLHTVGFCIRGTHSLNQAGLTLYQQANDPDALSRGLESVLAESPQFTVTKFGQ